MGNHSIECLLTTDILREIFSFLEGRALSARHAPPAVIECYLIMAPEYCAMERVAAVELGTWKQETDLSAHPVRAVSTSGGRVCQLCDRAPILDHECVEPAEVWVCCRATRCQLTRIPWNLDALKWIGENMRRKDMLVCDDCDQYLHKSDCLGFPPQVSSP